MQIAPYQIDVSPEEAQMGVVHTEVLQWDRTTLVKIVTMDHYEAIGTYTVSRGVTHGPSCIAIARGNAARRLQMSNDRAIAFRRPKVAV